MDEICKIVLKDGRDKMAGKITSFFRECMLIFSVVLTILGFILLFVSTMGVWFQDVFNNAFNFMKDYINWSLYLLIIGFIVFATGVWYLYSYLKKRKFLLDEIKTNKRSELIKKHTELKNTARHLPSKYQKMLEEKEEEFNIK